MDKASLEIHQTNTSYTESYIDRWISSNEISVSHSDDYDDYNFLWYDVEYSGKTLPTFQMNIPSGIHNVAFHKRVIFIQNYVSMKIKITPNVIYRWFCNILLYVVLAVTVIN
jgi:hypothetical protein